MGRLFEIECGLEDHGEEGKDVSKAVGVAKAGERFPRAASEGMLSVLCGCVVRTW